MSKIYADHDDFHVKATVFYMDGSANLFEDSECTKHASKEDVIDAFKKGTLLLAEPNGDEIVRPTSINVNDATVGTGGSGGGAKLYRHDIVLEDLQESGTEAVFTIYNADSRDYSSYLDYDYDECCYIGSHAQDAYHFLEEEVTICANGTVYDAETGQYAPVATIRRWGSDAEVTGVSGAGFTFHLGCGNIDDHVTQIL